ncbi:MAG TPA: hypothetical protein VMZ25_08505 [Terriglobales bacterium]|nr:hypothetical protein [Terriglobales bacterium]
MKTVAASDDGATAGRAEGTDTAAKPIVPRLVKFGGGLKDITGAARTGTVALTFSLYREATGGAPLWQETQNLQLDAQGRYNVMLGAGLPLPAEIFTTNEARWLGVQVLADSEPEQPRVLLVSVPYALKSQDAETLGGLPASAYVRSDTIKGMLDASVSQRLTNTRTQAASRSIDTGIVSSSSGGTADSLPKFSATDTLVDSIITEKLVGSDLRVGIGLGATSPSAKLHINGRMVADGFDITTSAADSVHITNSHLNGSAIEANVSNTGGGQTTAVFASAESANGTGIFAVALPATGAPTDTSFGMIAYTWNPGAAILGLSVANDVGGFGGFPTFPERTGIYAGVNSSTAQPLVVQNRHASGTRLISGRNSSGTEVIGMTATGNMTATGTVTANAFVGDGSALTNITAATATNATNAVNATNANTANSALTANALATNPADCTGNGYATAIDASGNLTCVQPASTQLTDTLNLIRTNQALTQTIQPTANVTPLIVRGAAGSTSDLLDVRNSLGGTMFKIDQFGQVATMGTLSLNTGWTVRTAGNIQIGTTANSANVLMYANNAGTFQMRPADNAAATASANLNNSPLKFCGSFWDGSAAADDCWRIVNTLGAGSNPTSTLNFLHAGTPNATIGANFTGNVAAASFTGDGSGLTGITATSSSTATALATNPTDCSSGQFATTIDAQGNLGCAAIQQSDVAGLSALSTAVTGLQTDVTGLQTTITNQGTAISGLQSTATSLGTAITGLTSDVSGLQTTVTSQGTAITGLQTSVSGLSADLTALTGTVTTQGTAITGLSSDVSGLQTTVTSQGTAISGLQTTVTSQGTAITGLTSDVSGLQTTVANQGTSITGLSGSVSTLSSDLTALTGTVSTQGSSITSLNTSVSGLQTSVTGLSTDVSGLQTTVGNQATSITSLNGSVSALQADVSGLQTAVAGQSGAITTLNGSVSGLQTSVSSLNTTVGTLQIDLGTLQTSVSNLGSSYVDLSNPQTIAGTKTFSATIAGSISGNAATATLAANSGLLNGKADSAFEQLASKNAASGYAGLNAAGQIAAAQAAANTAFTNADNAFTAKQTLAAASAAAASLNMDAGTAPTTPAQGDIWNEGGVLKVRIDGTTTKTVAYTDSASSGNATTATSLAADPTDCSSGQFATTIDAQGNLGCAAIQQSDVAGLSALSSAVTTLQSDVSGLQTTVSSQGTSITSLQGDVTGLQTTVGSQATSITSLNTSVGGLQTSVTGLTTDLTALTGTVTTQGTTISGLQTTVTSQGTAISGLTSDVSGLQTTVSGQGTAITGLQTTVTSQGTAITGLTSDVSGLQTTVTGQGTAITGLQTSVSGLSTDLTALTGTVTTQGTAISGLQTTVSSQGTAITGLTSDVSGLQTTVSAQGTAISGLTSDVSGLQSTVTSQGTAISGLQTTVTNQGTAITGLTSDVSGLQTTVTSQGTAITGLTSDVSGLQTTVAGQGTSISTLTSDLSTLSGTVAGQGTSISTLTSDLSTLSATVSGQGTSISGLQTAVTGQAASITSLNGSVSGLQTSVTSLNSSVSTLQSDVGALQTSVSNLGGSYVDLSNPQTIAGTKTFSSTIAGSISGNAATATLAANSSLLNGKADSAFEQLASKNVASGYAGLDASGQIAPAQAAANTAFNNADNAFTAKQTFAPATTGAASVNIDAGTAPTSPLQGDIWNEGGVLKVRIDGTTTKTLAYTDSSLSGGTFTGDVIGNLTGNVNGNVTGDLTGNVTGDVTGNVSGNAGTVTNGVYTTGSYADPVWITSLNATKITGTVANATNAVNATNATNATSATNATNATNATQLAANPADCAAGQYATTIAANGDLTCAAVAFSQLSGTSNIAVNNANNNFSASQTVTGTVTASAFVGPLTGNVSGDVTGNVSGNAATVTNGVYTTGSYADPAFITSLAGSKITGNISGNAATVTNGVYTTGSYANPAFITSLAGSKITGNIGGNAATASVLAANPTDCGAGQYATTIDASGNLTCAQVDASQLSGTSNFAVKNANNNFSSSQTVTGTVTATAFSGPLTGNVTGNLTGDVTGNVSGNAGTVTNGVYTIGNQTIAGTKTFTGSLDASTAATTLPIRVSSTFPATCSAEKEMLIKTGGVSAGQQVFLCNSTGNGWNMVGDGLGNNNNLSFNPVTIAANQVNLIKNTCTTAYTGVYPANVAGQDIPIPPASGSLSSSSTLVASVLSSTANSMPAAWDSYTFQAYVDSTGTKSFLHVCNLTLTSFVTSGAITFNVRAIN